MNPNRRTALPAAGLLLIVSSAACQQTAAPISSPALSYPVAKKGDVVDDYFGTKVADPYRWMEDLDSADVASWVAAENEVTFDYLADAAEARAASTSASPSCGTTPR